MKKHISIILVTIMTIIIGLNIYASQAPEVKQEIDISPYIIKARELLNIGTEYDDISSSVDERGVSIYWRLEADESLNVERKNENVLFSKDFVLLDYNRHQGEYSRFPRTNISLDEAKEKAEAFLKKAYPEAMFKYENLVVQDYERNLTLVYRLYVDGVKAYNANIVLSFNREKGYLSNVRLSENTRTYLTSKNRTKMSKKNIKSEEEAKKAIQKSFPLLLNLINYDEDSYTPVYSFTSRPLIDAKNFEKVPYINKKYNYGYDEAKEDVSGESVNENALTKEELEEAKKVKNLKTEKEALNSLNKLFNIDVKSDKESRLYKIDDKKIYMYNFEFKKGEQYISNASITAENLYPMSFYRYENDDKKYEEKAMNNIIKGILDALPYSDEYEKMDYKTDYGMSKGNNSRAYYVRKIDEYYLLNDTIDFNFDSQGLYRYSLNRLEDEIKFDKKKIEAAAAYQVMFNEAGFDLYYVPIYDIEGRLKNWQFAYGFEDNYNYVDVDAISGKIHEEKKIAIFEPKGQQDDKDISDLVAIGFGVGDEKQYSDKASLKDMIYNLWHIEEQGDYYRPIKDMLKSMQYNYITDVDKEDFDRVLTGKDVVKLLSINMFGDKLKNFNEKAFSEKFSAKGPDKIYLGMAVASGIVDDDFDINQEVTVEQMLKIISKVIFKNMI